MQLSPHFTLEEMTASQIAARRGIPNDPNETALENLKRLTKYLEGVRQALAKPFGIPRAMVITSGYRSPEVNRLVGSSPGSQHTIGCAADFKVHGMKPDEVMKAIVDADLPFDQLILEFDSWVHISIPSAINKPWRKQALIIDSKGTRTWPSPS